MNQEIFKILVFKHLKRIIGFIDIDRNSKTFGCADRYYWHYRLNDYYNSRFQESALILAFAYSDKSNFLYQNKKLLELIKGMIYFWAKNQNGNGSQNEIFPYEQSFCATSFTAYIMTEVIQLLSLKQVVEEIKPNLEKTGKWLCVNGNWHISNQIAASAMALHNLGKILENENFIAESKSRVGGLFDQFKDKIYFPEYGGFDLGYNSLTMSILARYYQKTQDGKLKETLVQSCGKVNGYLDNNGAYDNMGMSRNTEYLYPFCFKVMESPVLEKIRNGLKNDIILNPDWLDDRYLIGLSNDYLMAYYL